MKWPRFWPRHTKPEKKSMEKLSWAELKSCPSTKLCICAELFSLAVTAASQMWRRATDVFRFWPQPFQATQTALAETKPNARQKWNLRNRNVSAEETVSTWAYRGQFAKTWNDRTEKSSTQNEDWIKRDNTLHEFKTKRLVVFESYWQPTAFMCWALSVTGALITAACCYIYTDT